MHWPNPGPYLGPNLHPDPTVIHLNPNPKRGLIVPEEWVGGEGSPDIVGNLIQGDYGRLMVVHDGNAAWCRSDAACRDVVRGSV